MATELFYYSVWLNFFSNPELRDAFYSTIPARKLIQRERAKSGKRPVNKSYSSVKEFADDILGNPEEKLSFTLKNGEKLQLQATLLESKTKAKKNRPAKTYHHVAFYDEEFIKQFNDENDIFVDGTWDFCADIKGTRQVLIILAKKNFIVSI